MTERWLEYLPLDALRPDPRNPKDHDLDALRASMGRFGYGEPITLDERTGLLVSGHGRRELLLDDFSAGREPPGGVTVDDRGGWLVPVARGWSSRDDAEALEVILILNRATEQGGWDDRFLTQALAHLAERSLAGTGFVPADLEEMLARQAAPPSLSELADRYGTHDPAALWPVLRFKVPPELRDRFDALAEGDDDVARFVSVLDLAEAADAARVAS